MALEILKYSNGYWASYVHVVPHKYENLLITWLWHYTNYIVVTLMI